MLKFESSWRFTSPGPVSAGLVNTFYDYIEKIAPQAEDTKRFVERCRMFFGGIGGSSSESWAWTDLDQSMRAYAQNAPLFIDAFYQLCHEAVENGMDAPDLSLINKALADNNVGYEIRPPYIVASKGYAPPIHVPRELSLSERVRPLIDESLATCERLLDEGQGRRAVQEILFLLESIITGFRGIDTDEATIQGKYFNEITRDLNNQGQGKPQAQIISWMQALYGYLSSPTGGGVRHGVDLQEITAIRTHEARLYCNLIRSYVTFLMEENDLRTKPTRHQ